LTETIFITLLWSAILFLQRFDDPQTKNSLRWLTLGGIALALACLTRAPLQLFLIVALFWIGWRARSRGGWAYAVKCTAYFTVVVSSFLLPFMIRNYLVHKEATLAPGGGAEMFALGNSPEYLRTYEARTKNEYYQIFSPLVEHVSLESKNSLGQWLDEVREFRRERPADWWRLQWYKFKHYWTPWLNPLIFSRTQVLISAVIGTPLFLLAALELWRRR